MPDEAAKPGNGTTENPPPSGNTTSVAALDPNAPTVIFSGPVLPGISTEKIGDSIGRYKLLEELGVGGFGIVWRAEQHVPIHREVALKVIKPGMDSREIIARFEAERQALALMDHPNIAGVLDAGATDNGRPYFVMELVKGVPITDYCDDHKFTIRERLELFIPVCQAVQHAHQKAILHRDLKPSNILVTEVDGKAVPKVIDFGIAKALGTSAEAALQATLARTVEGMVVGTPQYMSPEQAGSGPDMDTRSDIYTLGVILYELLVGNTPLPREQLKKAAFDEVFRLIREFDPVRPSSRVIPITDLVRQTSISRGTEPSKLTRALRGDLDWITLKALEKERERRYDSAAAFAQDIGRHLKNEPVEAGPPSALYRMRKLVQRNRLAVAAAAVILTLLIAGIAVSTWQAVRATRAEKRADGEAQIAKAVNDFLKNDLLQQAGSREQAKSKEPPNPNLTVREALDRASKTVGNRFHDQPLVEAAIRDSIGGTYFDLGDPRAALPHYRRAVEIRTDVLGAEHPQTMSCRSNLAAVLIAQGKYAEAEMDYRTLLVILQRVLGSEHPDSLIARNNLASALFGQGKFAEVESEYRVMLDILRRVLGPEHPHTLQIWNNFAGALKGQQKYAEAEVEFQKLLAIAKHVLGPEHPECLMFRLNLAYVLDGQQKWDEAAQELREVIAIQRRVLGEDHLETLRSRVALAYLIEHTDVAKGGRQEKELRAILAICLRLLGEEHPFTLEMRENLSETLWYEGEGKDMGAEAEMQIRTVVTVREHVLGTQHQATLASRDRLINTLQGIHKNVEAETELRALVVIRERVLGAEHPDTLRTRNELAMVKQSLGKLAEAEKEQRDVLAICERVLGVDDPQTLHACYCLAKCLGQQSKKKEALPFARRALAGKHNPNSQNYGELVQQLEKP